MKRFAQTAISAFLLLSSASAVYAQSFSFDTGKVPYADLGKLLANVLVVLFFFAALLAFIFIVIGGLQWITAGGDKAAAQAARDRITAAVVGLIIVVAAFALTLIITTVLGINIFTGSVTFPGAENPIF